jgi:hypothetical protein
MVDDRRPDSHDTAEDARRREVATPQPTASDGQASADPYLRMITEMSDLVAQGLDGHFDELKELRAELEAQRSEIDGLRAELRELRDMKAQFAEVRAQAAESASKVAQAEFRLTRIAHDRRGEPGRDGEVGPRGPAGKDGVGLRGPKGEKGDRIVSWTYDLQEFRCTPMFSDGRPGVPIDFKPILEAAYASAMITDDYVVEQEAVEDYYQRDYEARMARFNGG